MAARSVNEAANFFFSSRRRHTRCGRDWSSDVCSSDLNARQARPEGSLSAVIAAGRIHRPVHQKGAPHNGVAVHKSPVAAILAVVAIVTHGEVFSGGNNDLVALHVFPALRPPFGDYIWRFPLASARGKGK